MGNEKTPPVAIGALQDMMTFSQLPAALAIGVFDGVHRGHRALLDAVTAMARETGALPVAMTFDPHPRAVLGCADAPTLLTPLAERLRLLRAAGMATTVVVPFTAEFAAQAPTDFLDALLQTGVPVAAVGVGSRWRFGRGAAGDTTLLAAYAARHHWGFAAVPELFLNGEVVSSSAIRRLIAAGRLTAAAELLGRPVRWFGQVGHGRGVAGPALHCPTTNLELSAGVAPPDGVYAGQIRVAGAACWFPAAFNIGVAPTYGAAGPRRIEAHWLDFAGDLYDRAVEFELWTRLRAERKFASESELRTAIAADVARIREAAKGREI